MRFLVTADLNAVDLRRNLERAGLRVHTLDDVAVPGLEQRYDVVLDTDADAGSTANRLSAVPGVGTAVPMPDAEP